MELELVVIADVVVVAEIAILAIHAFVFEPYPHGLRQALPCEQGQTDVVVTNARVADRLGAVEVEGRPVAVTPAEFLCRDAQE